MQCLLRCEAIRALSTQAETVDGFDQASRHSASTIAGRAWQVTTSSDLFSDLSQSGEPLAYCVAIQLCEALDSNADRTQVRAQVMLGGLKFPGCASCPSRCRYGDDIEITVRRLIESDDSASLKELWKSRFDKPYEEIVPALVSIFLEFAAHTPEFIKVDVGQRSVMGFCAALHTRALWSLLDDAGAKAANPQAWWGETMASGFGLTK
jgi:hypothetical protein